MFTSPERLLLGGTLVKSFPRWLGVRYFPPLSRGGVTLDLTMQADPTHFCSPFHSVPSLPDNPSEAVTGKPQQ